MKCSRGSESVSGCPSSTRNRQAPNGIYAFPRDGPLDGDWSTFHSAHFVYGGLRLVIGQRKPAGLGVGRNR